jgi:hypothetical protein
MDKERVWKEYSFLFLAFFHFYFDGGVGIA